MMFIGSMMMADYWNKAITPRQPTSTNAQPLTVAPQAIPAVAQPVIAAPTPTPSLINAPPALISLATPNNLNVEENPKSSPSNIIPVPTESVIVEQPAPVIPTTVIATSALRKPSMATELVVEKVAPAETLENNNAPLNTVHNTTGSSTSSQQSKSNSQSSAFIVSKPVIIIITSASVSIFIVLIVYILKRKMKSSTKPVNDVEKNSFFKSFCPSYISDSIEPEFTYSYNSPVSCVINDTVVGSTRLGYTPQSSFHSNGITNDIYDTSNSFISTYSYDTVPTTTEISQFQFSMKSSQVFYPNSAAPSNSIF